jgi:tetrahydromethanopterin S-methyltransferase subunit G
VFVQKWLQPDGVHPGEQVNSIGNSGNGDVLFFLAWPDTCPHLLGYVGVLLAYRVAILRHAQGKRRHVESGARIGWIDSKLQNRIAVGSKPAVGVPQILFKKWEGKHIRASRQRSMCCKHGTVANLGKSLLVGRSFFDKHANPFQKSQARMSLVNVDRGGLYPELLKDTHAAHSQHDFLPEPLLGFCYVKPIRDGSVPGLIACNVGIEKIDRHTPNVGSPHEHVDRRIEQRYLHRKGRAIGIENRLYGVVGAIQNIFLILLPPVIAQTLRNIAARVNQPYRHNRHREIAAFLDVIARQNSQATGIQGQGIVKSVLRRKIGDRSSWPAELRRIPARG